MIGHVGFATVTISIHESKLSIRISKYFLIFFLNIRSTLWYALLTTLSYASASSLTSLLSHRASPPRIPSFDTQKYFPSPTLLRKPGDPSPQTHHHQQHSSSHLPILSLPRIYLNLPSTSHRIASSHPPTSHYHSLRAAYFNNPQTNSITTLQLIPCLKGR